MIEKSSKNKKYYLTTIYMFICYPTNDITLLRYILYVVIFITK